MAACRENNTRQSATYINIALIILVSILHSVTYINNQGMNNNDTEVCL